MPERILYPDFRQQQLETRYPFADHALLVSDDGLEIPADTFFDASLYPIGGQEQLGISLITIASRAITFSFSDAGRQVRCTASFDPLDPPYSIPCLDAYGRPAGILLSEPLRLAVFTAWPVGEHAFSAGQAELAAGVVIPTPEVGLRGLLTVKGELLAGDIWLVGDQGIVVRQDGEGVIRIDAVGDPLHIRRLCQGINFTPPLFVQTINGCPPDEFGNYNLTVGAHEAADTTLRISPSSTGLRIETVGQTLRG